MKPIKTKFATHDLAKPENWDEETQGPCGSLPVAFVPGQGFVSFWQPTPEELKMLNAGGAVKLWVVNTSHPPVSLEATDEHMEKTEFWYDKEET